MPHRVRSGQSPTVKASSKYHSVTLSARVDSTHKARGPAGKALTYIESDAGVLKPRGATLLEEVRVVSNIIIFILIT